MKTGISQRDPSFLGSLPIVGVASLWMPPHYCVFGRFHVLCSLHIISYTTIERAFENKCLSSGKMCGTSKLN